MEEMEVFKFTTDLEHQKNSGADGAPRCQTKPSRADLATDLRHARGVVRGALGHGLRVPRVRLRLDRVALQVEVPLQHLRAATDHRAEFSL